MTLIEALKVPGVYTGRLLIHCQESIYLRHNPGTQKFYVDGEHSTAYPLTTDLLMSNEWKVIDDIQFKLTRTQIVEAYDKAVNRYATTLTISHITVLDYMLEELGIR